ncbi:hypothetical protein QR680_019203 [Steinernema hermaphroditum]|uniref:G-protein coupled receptors family 1 profile domain-containing protein n=1 Tax=Steinernema hermaphroditum TaxID=289476 RepID=A0AA39HML8_9BILA|nr:hypothetical protein QR680_019203 [Steinernema hermaphroditum]
MTDFEVSQNVSRLLDEVDANLRLEWYYLILAVVPIACIVGNCLVVTAVWTTRSLQTPTNYLLVSLAMADLLVGTFVMPFSIYLSVNGLHWHLPITVCHVYCVLDVAASTSSIVHLVLISIDRLVAATKPAEYKTLKHRRRVYIAIVLTWLFSIGLSLPLGTGFNTKTRQFLLTEHHCGIYNPIYMFCSSIFAFYLPCFIMIITYGYIFYTLRKRLRAIQLQEMAGGQFLGFGADVGNITTSAIQSVIGIAPKNRNMISWEKPLLKKIEETAAEHASSLNDSEREQLQTILEAVQPSSSGSNELTTTFEEDPDRPPSVVLEAVTLQPPSECGSGSSGSVLEVPRRFKSKGYGRRFSDAVQTTLTGKPRRKSVTICTGPVRRHSYDPQSEMAEEQMRSHSLRPPQVEKRKMRRLSELISDWERPSRSSLSGFSHMYSFARRESVYIARKKLAGLKDWALDLLAKLKSKQGMAIRRETRATKLVATVMVVFLACWLPFFTLNMIKVYKLMFNYWSSDLEILFHWFTALGYLNSSLNFFIYSAINQKFRSSFRRLIGFRSRRRRDKTWMLPPKDSSRGMGKYCGCGPFNKMGKKTTLRKASSAGMLNRKISLNKPEIVIDEVSKSSQKHISISAGGITTFRRSSDDCIRRSSSEIIGGVTFPSNHHESRRSSQMSNSSASLQLHDMHQLTLSIEVEQHPNRRYEIENDQVEIFV